MIVFQALFCQFMAVAILGMATLQLDRLARAKALHNCRETALNAQTLLAKGISNMMRLNQRADLLQDQVEETRRLLAASPTPPQKAALLARLNALMSLQRALALQQQSLRQSATSSAMSKLRYWSARQKEDVRTPPSAPWALQARRPSLAPPYEEVPQFEEAQSLQLSLLKNQREWIKCGATLEKESFGWRVRLSAGR